MFNSLVILLSLQMGELQFDTMEVDTQLAQEFLKANKTELDLFFDESKENEPKSLQEVTKITSGVKHLDLNGKLMALAGKIEESTELFAQLEALKRIIPKNDIKSYDIKHIAQNFKYMSYCNDTKIDQNVYTRHCILMGQRSPLASLGLVAQYLKQNQSVEVQYCDATGAICYLFAQLCSEIGLENINFTYKKQWKEDVYWKRGCTAVITEHSDLDSAVDAVLTSTSAAVQYKFKLKRLYVQECVYERFKKSLSWKCNLKGGSDRDNCGGADVNPQSSEVFIYDQKVFLCDYAGNPDQIKDERHMILVEAYRTSKELLSLAKKGEPFCVSLWSNDISEANELAYNLNVDIVWINDYGVFDGPMKVSQALYRLPASIIKLDKANANKFLKMSEGWLKTNIYDRVEKIKQALDKTNSSEIISEIYKTVNNLASNKFVEIEKGKMVVGIDGPNGVILQTEILDLKHFTQILTSVVYGNVVIVHETDIDENIQKILQLFEQEKVPFIYSSSLEEHGSDKTVGIHVHASLYQTRIVYSNFGTIFAN